MRAARCDTAAVSQAQQAETRQARGKRWGQSTFAAGESGDCCRRRLEGLGRQQRAGRNHGVSCCDAQTGFNTKCHHRACLWISGDRGGALKGLGLIRHWYYASYMHSIRQIVLISCRNISVKYHTSQLLLLSDEMARCICFRFRAYLDEELNLHGHDHQPLRVGGQTNDRAHFQSVRDRSVANFAPTKTPLGSPYPIVIWKCYLIAQI